MGKYRQVCHSVLCAHHGCHSTGGHRLCEPDGTSTGGSKSCHRAPTVCAHPVKLHCWLKGPANPAREHEGNGRTPTDHFIQDWIPMYIRIDIMTQGSVDLKVKCHPHQAPDEGSSALQKPFHKVNYINYQHLSVLNLWFIRQHEKNRFGLFYKKRSNCSETATVLAGEKQFFWLLHKDTRLHPTVSTKGHRQVFLCQTENREIHILSNVSTPTLTHPLGEKHEFVGRKTKLSVEKPLSWGD